MLPRLMLLLLLLSTSQVASATSSCDLPDWSGATAAANATTDEGFVSDGVSGELSLSLAYIRLTVGCAPPDTDDAEDDDDDDHALGGSSSGASSSLSASLLPAQPPGQLWPPPAAALLANVRFALAVLDGLLDSPNRRRRRLSRLSLGGLPLGGLLTPLVPALAKFDRLARLNLTAVNASRLPAGLLRLPQLRRLDAGGNPLDCRLPANRWAALLSRLGSSLLAPSPLMSCPVDDVPVANATSGTDAAPFASNATDSVDANATDPIVVIDTEPAWHEVDRAGDLRLPCSALYFRPADAGLWSPSDAAAVRVVWRRLVNSSSSVADISLTATPTAAAADVNESSSLSAAFGLTYRPSQFQFASRLSVGADADGAPLLVGGLRQAVVGLWRCELAKAGVLVAARHRLVLRPPLAGVEVACYVVAAATTVVMVLIGLLAAFLRGMVRTRCCSRVVHIVEAQSVHNLDASPSQSRRSWRPLAVASAASASATSAGGDISPAAAVASTSAAAAGPSTSVSLVEDDGGDLLGDVGPGGGWRNRLRGLNDQMRLHMASSVEHFKEQMRSVAELCGTNAPLGQTVSVVSVYTDPEGRQEPMERHLHLLSSV